MCIRDSGYTYICDDPNIHIGHAVVVPVGKENTEKTALVVQKYHALPKDITFPVEKLKRVIRRYSHFDPITSKNVFRNLKKLGRILDVCSKNANPNSQQTYYSIKTPLGYFLSLIHIFVVLAVLSSSLVKLVNSWLLNFGKKARWSTPHQLTHLVKETVVR